MQIDLRLLRHARALMDHGSFSRAAIALNISQPTLSRSIGELEERVGLPLFTRSRSGIEPTDFGRVFMAQAGEVMVRVGDLEREVELAKGLQTGEVAVGLGPYVECALAPICATRFAAAHPSVRLRILLDSPATLTRQLRSRAIDLVTADASMLDDDDEIEVISALTPLPGYVVTRTGHPLAGKAGVQLDDLFAYPYAQVAMLPPRVLKPILAKRSSATMGNTVAPPFPAIECPTARLAFNVVEGSDAFTFATLSMVRTELEQRRVVPIFHEPWLRTEWSIFHLRRRTLSPASAALVVEISRAHDEIVREEAQLRKRWPMPGTASAPMHKAQRKRRP